MASRFQNMKLQDLREYIADNNLDVSSQIGGPPRTKQDIKDDIVREERAQSSRSYQRQRTPSPPPARGSQDFYQPTRDSAEEKRLQRELQEERARIEASERRVAEQQRLLGEKEERMRRAEEERRWKEITETMKKMQQEQERQAKQMHEKFEEERQHLLFLIEKVENLAKKVSSGDAPDFELKKSDVKLKRKVGSGGAGNVYEGQLPVTVAVKELFDVSMKVFIDEMKILQSAKHPNIVEFIGYVVDSTQPLIIMEYMENLSLKDAIHKRANDKLHFDHATFFSIATDVAQGMSYLHSHNPMIIHHDLKAANILIDSTGRAKVADFGLAKTKSSSRSHSSSRVVGTYAYMAPEAFSKRQQKTEKVDVYSYGVMLWEMLTLSEAWTDYDAIEFFGALNMGERPDIPEDCAQPLRELIENCWHQVPSKRPTFQQILMTLGEIAIPVKLHQSRILTS